jgi:hypothetical protein
MATVPLSGTNIRLMSGIPFTSDYKNSRWFDNITDQTNYFLNKNSVFLISESNFQRIENHTFISVNEGIDDLWNVNYIMFQNASYNNKWFYAFVTKLEYKQKKTTYIYFEIDVLQTWMFQLNFKPSFVVREHCPLWNEDGSPVINTVDEGLNYGTEYDVVFADNCKPYNDIFFLVIVCKSAMHDSNNIDPTLNGLPQPLSYYVHPFKLDGSDLNVSVGGGGLTLSKITEVIKGIMTQTKAINDVVSLYVTDYIGCDTPLSEGYVTFDSNRFQKVTIGTIDTVYVKSIPSYEPITKTFTDKYANYHDVTESKLLMYPYTVLILDDFKGNRRVLKNEYINNKDINLFIKGSLGTENKVAYSIDDYNQLVTDTYAYVTGMENAVINNNPNDIPILNDYLAAFLQGHKNSINVQKQSAYFNGIVGGITSGAGAMAAGWTGNAAGVAQGLGGIVSSGGNAILQIQAIEAKQKDIGNIPPSIASMGSNSNFDYGNYFYGMYLIKKQIKPEYIKKLTDFFNMFGYKKNEVKIPNLHTRQYWNYVQTLNCMITGDMNNQDLQIVKNIFDNGITLWHTDDIGNYALTNEVIA